jgi:hypothetical protein
MQNRSMPIRHSAAGVARLYKCSVHRHPASYTTWWVGGRGMVEENKDEEMEISVLSEWPS